MSFKAHDQLCFHMKNNADFPLVYTVRC